MSITVKEQQVNPNQSVIDQNGRKIISGPYKGWLWLEPIGIPKATEWIQFSRSKQLMHMLGLDDCYHHEFGKIWMHPIMYKAFRMWIDPKYAVLVLTAAHDPKRPSSFTAKQPGQDCKK